MKTNMCWKISNPNLHRLVSFLLILAMCLALFPQSASAEVVCKFKHKVQAGDTLITLGILYGIDWKEIADANELVEPYVLTIGQVLCIPGGTRPEGPTTTTTTGTGSKKNAPTLTVAAGINMVYVKVDNFPKFIVYYVNLSPRSDMNQERIGRLRTNKVGHAEDWIRIPADVHQTRFMTLCLKNVWTDAVSCIDYENPFFNLIPVVLCSKNGR
jgi:hypothetical protein